MVPGDEVPELSPGGPRIAITWSRKATSPADRYLEAVMAAGGVPLLVLPEDGPQEVRRAQGLLLAGGLDVHPARYGQEIDPRVAGTVELDGERDAFELEALAWALEAGAPVLGICRGIQLLNVALGGTLLQDLSLRGIDPAVHQQRHRFPPLQEWEPAHSVRLDPASHLARILGGEEAGVNSFHHQAVDVPAGGLRVVARAPDGLVEGVEAVGLPFVLGVQWHPERMAARDPRQRALFAALVEAAARFHRR